MKELKGCQGSAFGVLSRIKLIENRDTILEFTAEIQELQNEINCMNFKKDFHDAEPARSGQPLIQILVDCKPFRTEKMGRQTFRTHVEKTGNVVANPAASSSAPYPQESNPWSSKKYQNKFTHHRR